MKEEAESRGSPTPTPPECTFGAYEMTLPKSFKISTFVKEAKSGRNGFWLIAFPEPEIVSSKSSGSPSGAEPLDKIVKKKE